MMRMIVPVVDDFKVVLSTYCQRMQLTPEIAAITKFLGSEGQNEGDAFDNGFDIDHLNLKDGAILLPCTATSDLYEDLLKE